jgi:hypothetical protein
MEEKTVRKHENEFAQGLLERRPDCVMLELAYEDNQFKCTSCQEVEYLKDGRGFPER